MVINIYPLLPQPVGFNKSIYTKEPVIYREVSKPVLQYDKQMNFIKEYVSITEASKLTNVNRKAIGNNLSERSKHSGGFICKYKEEDQLCQE